MALSELHPLAQEVSAQLGDHQGEFHMLVRFQVRNEHGPQLLNAFKTPITETRKEEGNIGYRVVQLATSQETFVVLEHWRDLAALDSHLKQPYLAALLDNLEPILTEPPAVDVFIEK